MFDNPEKSATAPDEMSQEEREKLELATLKKRADQMGVKYSNNIKLETLRAKVAAKQNGEEEPTGEDEEDAAIKAEEEAAVQAEIEAVKNAELSAMPVPNSEMERRANPFEPVAPLATQSAFKPSPVPAHVSLRAAKREAQIMDKMRLVRCRITNMDPKKKDLPGEVFAVGNELIGTVKKFIPYGEATEGGYHIPLILYNNLKERRFLQVKTSRDPKNGRIRVHTSYQREFNLEVLPLLSEEELNDLKQAQIAAGSVENPSLD